MSRRLDDLSSDMLPLATVLIARVVERGLAVLIVDTLRTEEEHLANLKKGTSATRFSRHLPRFLRTRCAPDDPNRNKSDAIDLAPYNLYQLHGPDKLQWDVHDPAWQIIGQEAEKLGLIWGGRWQKPHDPGHAELPRSRWDSFPL